MIENGAIATKKWRNLVTKFLYFLCLYPLLIPPAFTGLVWFLSLGHLNYLDISCKPLIKLADIVNED